MSNRSLRNKWPIVYGFPIILIVMTLAVLGSRSRHLYADQISLIAILGVACFLYLRKPWAVVLSLVFALLSLEVEPAPPQSSGVTRVLRAIAVTRFPAPVADPRDFVDHSAIAAYNRKVDQEVRLYHYFGMNVCVFAGLLAARRAIDARRAAKQADVAG